MFKDVVEASVNDLWKRKLLPLNLAAASPNNYRPAIFAAILISCACIENEINFIHLIHRKTIK